MSKALVTEYQAVVQDYVANWPTYVNDLKAQAPALNVDLKPLLFVDFVYLGAFALIGFILPSFGTLVYGGDSDHYSEDWARALCAANIGLALVVLTLAKWEKSGKNADAKADLIKVLFVFFAVNAISNLFIMLYGSLSTVSFLNAVAAGGLAFLHFKKANLVAVAPKASE